jgi:hypothetical protein
MSKKLINFALITSLMVGGFALALVPSSLAQVGEIAAHSCGSLFPRESFITRNYRVDICQNRSQLFLIGKNLSNPSDTFRATARWRGDNSYIANGENGISFFVDPFGLTVQVNGRTIAYEQIISNPK